MKNIELYQTIEAIVKNNKLHCNQNKSLLPNSYTSKQVDKKQSIFINHKSKCSKLIKELQPINCYGNMDKFVDNIKAMIRQKQKNDDKPKRYVGFEAQNLDNDCNQSYEIIQKARQIIGPFNYKRYMKENEEIVHLINELQSKSNIGTYRRQNSPINDGESFWIKNCMGNNQDQKHSIENESWKFYERNSYPLDDTSQKKHKQLTQIDTGSHQSIKSRQENNQLTHQVATYLEIALENQQRKKWAHRKTITSHNGRQNFDKSPKYSKFRLKTEKSKHLQKGLHQKVHSKKQEPPNLKSLRNSFNIFSLLKRSSIAKDFGNSTISSRFFANKRVKQSFTFRNRNIKEGIIKKLNSFLDFVEAEEKSLKKQKCFTTDEINSLQNNQNHEYDRYCQQKFLIDEQQIRKIQSVAHLQK